MKSTNGASRSGTFIPATCASKWRIASPQTLAPGRIRRLAVTAMQTPPPPAIFVPQRRALRLARMIRRQQAPDCARYLADDVADDLTERLAFLRHVPARTLVLGDPVGVIGSSLPGVVDAIANPAFPLDQPWPVKDHDLIVACLALDTVNDLPGALIHLRAALSSGGLALVTLLGAGSLPALRAIMQAADGDRPAPRIHPQVDVRAGAQLLQRAGFADPVSDSRTLTVRFPSLAGLVSDLRDQGLTGVLAQGGPPLGRTALRRAEQAFSDHADGDGRVSEQFELLTLSGWRR